MPASARMSKDDALRLLEEAKRRGLNVSGVDVLGGLFDKQREVVSNPSTRKIARCGRGSGKTALVVPYMVQVCLDNAGGLVLYMARTKGLAKRLIWDRVLELCRRHRVKITARVSDKLIRFPNGAEIWLWGADKEEEIEKLRGYPFRLVVLDESGSFGLYMEELIRTVLTPRLQDYHGTILLCGTPPASCLGFFWDADQGRFKDQYTHFHWTMLDNPLFPLWAQTYETGGAWQEEAQLQFLRVRKEEDLKETDHVWRREYLGEWVSDSTSGRVYPSFSTERNVVPCLPVDREWYRVLAIDFGFVNAMGFIDACWSTQCKEVYFCNGMKRTGMSIADVAQEVKHRQTTNDYVSMVADCGSLGKLIALELQQRFSLPIEAADKREKAATIALLDSDFRNGRAFILSGDPAIPQIMTLLWDSKRKQEQTGMENDLSDCCLYAYTKCLHYLSTTRPDSPKPGSREYAADKVEAMFTRRAKSAWWIPSGYEE